MGFAHSKAELGLGSWTGHGHLRPFRCPSSLPTAPGPRGRLWPEAPWTQALYKQDGLRRGRKPPLLGPQASPKRLPPGTHRQRGQGGEAASKPLSGGLRACTDAGGQACRCPGPLVLRHSPHARRSAPLPPGPAATTCTGQAGAAAHTLHRSRGGRQAGGRRGGGSPEQARGQTLPHTRQQTVDGESEGADREPTVQRAGVGGGGFSTVPFPVRPKPGLWWEGGAEGPWLSGVSGVSGPRGARHTQDGAASRGRGGRFGGADLGCVVEVLDWRAPEERLSGERQDPRSPWPAPLLLGAGHRLAWGQEMLVLPPPSPSPGGRLESRGGLVLRCKGPRRPSCQSELGPGGRGAPASPSRI